MRPVGRVAELGSLGRLAPHGRLDACPPNATPYSSVMATIGEVEKIALDLSESQRAVLAAHLLGSLPSVLHDEDDGIAEALRRDAELDAHPKSGMSLEQLDQQIERRRS